tara:strand:- start:46 stop:513 length:468 start_codon:yes stop_codon:yes gene_type:complete
MEIFNIKELVDKLTEKDIIKYLSVLNDLTNVYNDDDELKFLIRNFKDYVNSLLPNMHIYIMMKNNDIIGSGSLVVENKIIHGFGKVGHIEDVVIEKSQQNKCYGKMLLNHLIKKGKEFNCYKVVLNCDDDKIGFYEKIKPSDTSIKVSIKVSYYF